MGASAVDRTPTGRTGPSRHPEDIPVARRARQRPVYPDLSPDPDDPDEDDGRLQAPPDVLRTSGDRSVRDSLRSVSLAMAFLYVAIGISHLFIMPEPVNVGLAVVAIQTTAAFIVYWGIMKFWTVPSKWAHAVGSGMFMLVLLNALGALFLVQDPSLTINLMLLVIGLGVLFLSTTWLVVDVLLAQIAWAAIYATVGVGEPGWIEFGFGLFMASLVSFALHALRVRTHVRMENLRYQDKDRRDRLEEANRALHESESRFRTLADAAFEGIVILEDDRIVETNAAFRRLFGIPDSTVVEGSRIADFVHSADGGDMRLLARVDDDAAQEHGIRTADGHVRDIEALARRLPVPGRDLVVLAVRDITERKKAEEAERISLAQRLEIEKLKEMEHFRSRFLDVASHELNTPITPMKMQIHLLAHNPAIAADPKGARSVTVMKRNLDRLAGLVQNLLAVAKMQAGGIGMKTRPVDLARLVSGAVDALQEKADDKGVTIHRTTIPDMWVEADPKRLHEGVTNLLDNAIRFTPAGGRIDITLSQQDDESIVTVRDTGIGFDPERRDAAFRPFSHLHDAREEALVGAGLGLYMVREIVEGLEGRVWADSQGDGKGATFALALPRTRAPDPAADAPDGDPVDHAADAAGQAAATAEASSTTVANKPEGPGRSA